MKSSIVEYASLNDPVSLAKITQFEFHRFKQHGMPGTTNSQGSGGKSTSNAGERTGFLKQRAQIRFGLHGQSKMMQADRRASIKRRRARVRLPQSNKCVTVAHKFGRVVRYLFDHCEFNTSVKKPVVTFKSRTASPR